MFDRRLVLSLVQISVTFPGNVAGDNARLRIPHRSNLVGYTLTTTTTLRRRFMLGRSCQK